VCAANSVQVSTTTSTALLEGLRSPGNHLVWHRFCERYQPTIVRYGQSAFGLGEHDAEDAAQQTLAAFHEQYMRGDYDRNRGRLRGWLFGIATNQIRQVQRKNSRRRVVSASEHLEANDIADLAADDATLEQQWEQEWQRAVYQQCMVEVRRQFNAQTVEAFEMYARDGASARDVATRFGMTVNAVYLAKQHILKRIRELLPYMDDAY
jgi:RNA polymerase sigma-70 factor (ECF subfamily)